MKTELSRRIAKQNIPISSKITKTELNPLKQEPPLISNVIAKPSGCGDLLRDCRGRLAKGGLPRNDNLNLDKLDKVGQTTSNKVKS